tara:strand:- start:331 stop:522 length:192 start_codon:yes stop_codon:yes gene_type:complete
MAVSPLYKVDGRASVRRTLQRMVVENKKPPKREVREKAYCIFHCRGVFTVAAVGPESFCCIKQ